jgi:methylmalonyl-CoA mutase
MNLDPYNWEIIFTWDEKVNKYKNPIYSFKVRDKEIEIKTHSEFITFSNSKSGAYQSTKLGAIF